MSELRISQTTKSRQPSDTSLTTNSEARDKILDLPGLAQIFRKSKVGDLKRNSSSARSSFAAEDAFTTDPTNNSPSRSRRGSESSKTEYSIKSDEIAYKKCYYDCVSTYTFLQKHTFKTQHLIVLIFFGLIVAGVLFWK